MTESPFATTSRILSESSNSFDLLRIIAGESNNLSPDDRATLRKAADELESAQWALIKSNCDLIEAQQRAIALHDQIMATNKRTVAGWSYRTGWIAMENLK